MKLGLAFSGGKDSLACIFLNLHRIEEITVLFVNTGKLLPETLSVVDYVKSICPNFVEIFSNKDAQNAVHGYPSDIVPINWTFNGQKVNGEKPIKIQSYIDCCVNNIAFPLYKKANELGITDLICGQRSDESHKSASKDGDVLFGIKRLHPIESWTAKDVIDYLSEKIKLPDHFNLNHTSIDCYDCTGYLSKTKDIKLMLKEKYPEKFNEFKHKVIQIKQAIASEADNEWL